MVAFFERAEGFRVHAVRQGTFCADIVPRMRERLTLEGIARTPEFIPWRRKHHGPLSADRPCVAAFLGRNVRP